MDIKILDKAIVALVEKRIELSGLSYDDNRYDEIEEELHNMEDDFVDKYGDYLEGILTGIHDEHCSDTDVLSPIAYLAQQYHREGKNADGTDTYSVDPDEGVPVDADKFPGKDARLVLIPNPTRVYLRVGQKYNQEVWHA